MVVVSADEVEGDDSVAVEDAGVVLTELQSPNSGWLYTQCGEYQGNRRWDKTKRIGIRLTIQHHSPTLGHRTFHPCYNTSRTRRCRCSRSPRRTCRQACSPSSTPAVAAVWYRDGRSFRRRTRRWRRSRRPCRRLRPGCSSRPICRRTAGGRGSGRRCHLCCTPCRRRRRPRSRCRGHSPHCVMAYQEVNFLVLIV